MNVTDEVPIRDAATVILVRDPGGSPSVLMGQRGRSAVFMPDKFVFPGGALDADDALVPLVAEPGPVCMGRLDAHAPSGFSRALAAAAIRELWEETGLRLSRSGAWPDAPRDWAGFSDGGHRPDASALRFFFRAVTPPGRPRRFDARFFIADAGDVTGDAETFSGAGDELAHLQWVPLSEARALNLAFITELVLAELARHLPSLDAPARVPFIRNDRMDSRVIWLD